MQESEQQRVFDDGLGKHTGLLFKVVRADAFTPHDQEDLQVLPNLNLPEIGKALAAGKNPDVGTVKLPGLNHLFQRCETGVMNESITIQETIHPAALEKIGGWIASRTRSAQR
jgi:hypothetical protein